MGALPSWPPLNLPKVPFSNIITRVRTSFSGGYKYLVHYIYNILKLFYTLYIKYQFSSVQSLSHVWLFVTPWIAVRQASLSITNSRSSLKLTSIKSVMPSSHLILRCPLFLPPVPPSIRVFSNESTLHMGWPKYWSFSFNISPSNEHPGLISKITKQLIFVSYY